MSNGNSNQHRGATNKMLIDATHPEETRVVVLRNGRVEEFDYESAARKLLRGNIYLAKVTRVEPSLQAAFVDYGGNRHGFLAFNEIHPDYYQIPIADRRALLEAEAAAEAEEEAAADRAAEAAAARRARREQRASERASQSAGEDAEDNAIDVTPLLPPEPMEAGTEAPYQSDNDRHEPTEAQRNDDWSSEDRSRTASEAAAPDPRMVAEAPVAAGADAEHAAQERGPDDSAAPDDAGSPQPESDAAPESGERDDRGGQVETVEPTNGAEPEQVETVDAEEDALEEVPVRPRRRLRSYKIQEVTKRRQVLLVQVVKEERGTKGAALTTYLSLAGRYTVLMPNTARGGGISRKINNPQDRKRLKAIAAELDVPEGMGLIIRTAGASRTKQEIKRDYEYLLRLWESVRELALGSNAPALVYEEGNLIKRSIRDLYGKEVEEVIVAGDAAYREAKDFMRMLLPSHAKNVIHYQDPEPLFGRFQIERQLNAMFSPYVHLRSGGYLVINQTEALVAIDINSGKSTREFSIEETAYSTNMEAADEIARQVKLRDLAGLIVIDFIDMEEKRNNRSVERRLKDALRHDRARIQLGHISHFGLLEMSRQRMRTGVLEGSTTQCPHCQGTGIIRSTESVALAVLRGIEDALMSGQPSSLNVSTTATVALYILNNKRAYITEIEARYSISVQVLASDKMQGANFSIERTQRREDTPRRPDRSAVNMEWGFEDESGEPEAEADVDEAEDSVRDDSGPSASGENEGGPAGEGRKRRRRRRRGRRDFEGGERQHGERQHHGGGQPRFARDAEDAPRDHGGAEDDDGPREGVETRDQHDGDDGEADAPEAYGTEGRRRDESGEEGQGGRRGRRRRRGRRGGRRGHERGDGSGHADRSDDQHAGQSDELAPRDFAHEPVGRQEPHEHERHGGVEEVPTWQPVEVVTRPDTTDLEPVVAEPVREPAFASAQAAPAIQAQVEAPPPAIEQASPPPPAPRPEPVSSEPVLAHVVVGPDNAVVEAPQDAARPTRRGWWQRK